jgi:hypothetical protein
MLDISESAEVGFIQKFMMTTMKGLAQAYAFSSRGKGAGRQRDGTSQNGSLQKIDVRGSLFNLRVRE